MCVSRNCSFHSSDENSALPGAAGLQGIPGGGLRGGVIMIMIILGIIAVLAFLAVGIYNKYVKLKNLNEEGWSGIEVYLQKRLDLIPNLVNTVKGYATHEKETLENVVRTYYYV